MEDIEKYKHRRDARLKKRLDDEWITIKGTHVLIDDGGQVEDGPDSLKSVVKNSGGYKKGTKKSAKKEKQKGENYKEIFGNDISDGSISQSMKDEISSLRSVFGDAKIKSSGPWDDGEYEVNGIRVSVDDKSKTSFGEALKKYYDYKDAGGMRIYWDKEDTPSIRDYFKERPSTMEEDFSKEGYKKNREGRWEKVKKGTPSWGGEKNVRPGDWGYGNHARKTNDGAGFSHPQDGMSGNITNDIRGEWGDRFKSAPTGTTFKVKTDNRWHKEIETYTKTDNGWRFEREVDGRDQDKGNADLSRIWNSLRNGTVW